MYFLNRVFNLNRFRLNLARHCRPICGTDLRVYQFKNLLNAMIAIIFISSSAKASQICSDLFTETSEVNLLDSLANDMSSGMLLRPQQNRIFELYQKIFLGDPDAGLLDKGLKDVIRVIQKNPGLEKSSFREQVAQLSTTRKQYPPNLQKLIMSQNITNAQIRNRLYQAEAHSGYWKKLLSYEGDRFEKYFERIINQVNQKKIGQLASGTNDDLATAKALFKTLQYLANWMEKKSKPTQLIRQAMVDLIHAASYSHPTNLNLLKSKNPTEAIEGLQNAIKIRDDLSFELSGVNFNALLSTLRIDFPSGFSKNQRAEDVINHLQNEVLAAPFETLTSETFRVRSLSIQESPFRGCLGNDCSTRTYFESALDPNFHYFTMTDQAHQSSGQATLLLGQVKDLKVAFLDKLQNVPQGRIEIFLKAIQNSIRESGYQLVIPIQTGDHNGLSSLSSISWYFENRIIPRLSPSPAIFKMKPHSFKISHANTHSRGHQNPQVLFYDYQLKPTEIITAGKKYEPRLAAESLSFDQFFTDLLRLKNSSRPEDVLSFILAAAFMPEFQKDLAEIYERENFPSRIKKQALYSTLFAERDSGNAFERLEKIADADLKQILSEIQNSKDSSHPVRQYLYSEINLANAARSASHRIFLILAKRSESTINETGLYGMTALHVAAKNGDLPKLTYLLKIKNIQLSIKDNSRLAPLGWALRNRRVEAARLLTEAGARFEDSSD